ncbi:MAG: hypothetical protein LQ338_001075 [Usnochroma carphineum]|nr:MAG: hypothetical protein LQ338_001075 [Usnochroma carphineum]
MHLSASIGKTAQDEAVGLARDQYLRQLERRCLDRNPTVADAAIRRRSQKAFRKTVRTSSMNNYDSSTEAPRCPPKERPDPRGVGTKARDLSSSFKNRLKRVFNRTAETEGTLPAQHLQATRLHFGDTAAPYALSEVQRPSIESSHHSTPERSGPQQTDILYVPQRRGSLADDNHGATDSLDGDDNKSRVTSWTNSTAANTLALHQDSGRKRLSIIHENGKVPLHLGSPWQIGSLQRGALAAGDQPRKSSLYLKLQQRMSKSDSSNSLQPSHFDAGTIGTPPVDKSKIPSSSSPGTSEACKGTAGCQTRIHSSTSIHPTHAQAPEIENMSLLAQDPGVMPKEAQLQEFSDAQPKRPLRESKSMFFPQSTRIERSRTSPFRHAMRRNGLSEKTSPTDRSPSPAGRHEEAASLVSPTRTRGRSQARSESIYSRTSSGNTPQRSKTSESPARTEIHGESPAAAIMSNPALETKSFPTEQTIPTTKGDRPGPKPLKRASVPGLLLDVEQSPGDLTGSARPKKRSAHKREHAQITGEDTDIGRLQFSPRTPEHFPAGSAIGFDTRSSIRHNSCQPMVDRSPLMSLFAQPNGNRHDSKLPVNPKTVTSHLAETVRHRPFERSARSRENANPKQSATSLPSPNSETNAYSKQHCGGKHDRAELHDNFRQGNLLAILTPTSQSRSSPERMARLRRMYSSHNLGSASSRNHVESTSKVHENMYKGENQDVHETESGLPNRGAGPPGNRLNLVPDGRNMVDVFLNTRRKSVDDDMEGTVFI